MNNIESGKKKWMWRCDPDTPREVHQNVRCLGVCGAQPARLHMIHLRLFPLSGGQGSVVANQQERAVWFTVTYGPLLGVVFLSWGRVWSKKWGEILASDHLSFTNEDTFVPVPQSTLFQSPVNCWLTVRSWQPTPVFQPGELLWTEKPGGLQCIELQRVEHDWSDLAHTQTPSLMTPYDF